MHAALQHLPSFAPKFRHRPHCQPLRLERRPVRTSRVRSNPFEHTSAVDKSDEHQCGDTCALCQLHGDCVGSTPQPSMVPFPKYALAVGPSKYAQKINKQIREASRDQNARPVLVIGEQGTKKGEIAGAIHYSGPDPASRLALKIMCDGNFTASLVSDDTAERRGLASLLTGGSVPGTLVLGSFHNAPPHERAKLAELLRPRPDGTAPLGGVRVVVVASRAIPEFDEPWITKIRVPPLRVRRPDLPAEAERYLVACARMEGRRKTAVLDKRTLIELESYDFPLNLEELHVLLARGFKSMSDADPNGESIAPEHIWPSKWQAKLSSFNLNVLNAWGGIPRLISRSRMWPEGLFPYIAAGFTAVLIALWVGPQDREHSAALTAFWAWWWPGILIVYPALGRVWCSVCPFMVVGTYSQKLRTALLGPPGAWPSGNGAIKHGGWALWAMFLAILVWEEVWDLPESAQLSATLLLLITLGAVVCSVLWEDRFWCRHLCPIGGMNGMFAKTAGTEVRATKSVCAANPGCGTPCQKGGPELPGTPQMETAGCPLHSHPNHLTDNKDCVLCMSCVKACPNLSVEVHIRPLGEDLWNGHVGSAAEVALLFLLLGAPLAHHVRFLSPGTAEAFASPTMAGIALTLGAMCVPAAVLFGAEWGSRVFLMPAAGELAERVFGKDTLQAIAGATGTSLPLRRGDGAGVATGGSEAGRVAGTGTGGGRDRIPELAAAWRSLTNGKGPQLAAQGAGVAGGAAEVSIDGGEQDWLASVQKAMPRWFESGSGSQGLPETSIPPLLKFGATTEPWWPAYIYLPMVWAGNMAHYERLLLLEGGLVLPRLASMLGLDSVAPYMPGIAAAEDVVPFVQWLTLAFGVTLSTLLAAQLHGGWSRKVIPYGVAALLLGYVMRVMIIETI